MKTIFISAYQRQQARNILRNSAFDDFVRNPELRIVIFIPSYKVEEYKKEFGRENVIIEGIKEPPEVFSPLDNFFRHLAVFYVDTKMVRHNRWRFILSMRGARFRYWLSLFWISIFGNIKLLRQLAKFLDYKLIKDKYFGKFFDQYKPDLVFVPHISSRTDRAFLRQARTRGILSVGMVNSWDTITMSKFPTRVMPDKFLAFNEITKKEAIKYFDIKEKNIYLVGMPHFDHYINNKRCSREEFFKRIGLEPKKRLILLAPLGDTAWQIAEMIQDAIIYGNIPNDIQLLIRQHPNADMKMGELKLKKSISVIEKPVTFFESQGVNYSEILKDDMNHLADSLFYSNITINTCSTMSIDAAAFDKPVINIAFDGWVEKPHHESVKQFYDETRTHYLPVLKSGGVRLANNKKQLIEYINMYLKDPALDSEGRKKITSEQCWKLDGKAGERIFNYLTVFLKNEK